MPEPRTEMRHGLVENAGGGLRCPLRGCGLPLIEVMFVSVHTEYGHIMALPGTLTLNSDTATDTPGIPGMVIGMRCLNDHHTSLSLVTWNSEVSVKTEWDAEGRVDE